MIHCLIEHFLSLLTYQQNCSNHYCAFYYRAIKIKVKINDIYQRPVTKLVQASGGRNPALIAFA